MRVERVTEDFLKAALEAKEMDDVVSVESKWGILPRFDRTYEIGRGTVVWCGNV